jgi:hypothetical protein
MIFLKSSSSPRIILIALLSKIHEDICNAVGLYHPFGAVVLATRNPTTGVCMEFSFKGTVLRDFRF